VFTPVTQIRHPTGADLSTSPRRELERHLVTLANVRVSEKRALETKKKLEHSCAREKRRSVWQKDLQICGAREKSREGPTLVVGKNPNGKSQVIHMNDESEPTLSRAPTFGILSITAPLIGIVLIWVLLLLGSESEFGCLTALLLIPLTPVFGIVLAVGAWIRRERHRALPWVGAFINSTLLILLITNANRMVRSLNWGGH
jgi:hypothetical protein